MHGAAEARATPSAPSAAGTGNTMAAANSSFLIFPLEADLKVIGSGPGTVAKPIVHTPVVSHDFMLNAGESRRVQDRLEVTLSWNRPAEVDDAIACWFLDPIAGWRQLGDNVGSGTNHQGSAAGWLVLSSSRLVRADSAGMYRCTVTTYTSDTRTDYYESVASIDSFLAISAADELGAQQWTHQLCDSPGDRPTCEYLGDEGDPSERYLVPQLIVPPPANLNSPNLWTAANDATQLDVLGTFQITSCPHNTNSCTSAHRGPGAWFGGSADKSAQITSFLEFDQLYPDGTVCRSNVSHDPVTLGHTYDISNSVHHLPIDYSITVSVSPNCRGSRVFGLKIYVGWSSGNPVKVDGGNVTAINSVHAASTAIVPNVVGAGRDQAVARLMADGFSASVVSSVVNAAAPGTVIDQNAPSGTLEPTGSPVDLTLSLGGSTVPQLLGVSEARARQSIAAAGLAVGSVSTPNSCVDPGTVTYQSPVAGTLVLPGMTVNLIVPRCSGGPQK
jgi:hypothetical protein